MYIIYHNEQICDSNKIANILNEQFITNIQTINDEYKK